MRSSTADLQQLAAELRAGKVKTLVVLGGNPAYDAPADLDFGGRAAKATNRIRLGRHVDETVGGVASGTCRRRTSSRLGRRAMRSAVRSRSCSR